MVQSRAGACACKLYGSVDARGRANTDHLGPMRAVRTDPYIRERSLALIDALRRMLGRALLPARDRRTLDAASRDLLPPEGPHGRPASEEPPPDLDLGVEDQLALLARFEEERLQELFRALRRDPAINPGGGSDLEHAGAAVIQNGFYPTPDAEIYAALILLERPERIIEIGSGFSTAVARAAVRAGALQTEIHVIDPSPRRSVVEVADRVEYAHVEQSSLVGGQIPPHTLLFIDSSHVTRSGGDGPFLYGTLLPRLPAEVLVQIHDIFLPYDYPQVYVDRLYSEQYLLQALLANSAKFRPVLATHFLGRRHPEAMRRAFGDAVCRDGRQEGASYWMRSVA